MSSDKSSLGCMTPFKSSHILGLKTFIIPPMFAKPFQKCTLLGGWGAGGAGGYKKS